MNLFYLGPYTKEDGLLSYPEICTKFLGHANNTQVDSHYYLKKIPDLTNRHGSVYCCIALLVKMWNTIILNNKILKRLKLQGYMLFVYRIKMVKEEFGFHSKILNRYKTRHCM